MGTYPGTHFIILKGKKHIKREKGGTRSEFHAHSLLELYLGLVPGASASAVDAALKPYHFTVGGDDALPDVANSTENVFKTKLKLNSPLSVVGRKLLTLCGSMIGRFLPRAVFFKGRSEHFRFPQPMLQALVCSS